MFWRKKKNMDKDAASGKPAPVMSDIEVIIKTDLGNVRTNNEDNAFFLRSNDETTLREKGYLMMVADGMGGHLAGEVASKMAVDIISEQYYHHNGKHSPEKALAQAFVSANKQIFTLASTSEQHRGMGTTCTAIAVVGSAIYFAHAGDSRAYLFKNNSIQRITQDHTYVQELVNSGSITAAEADVHPDRNILVNAMGTKPELRVDAGRHTTGFAAGDRLMLCSDGLYDYLDDKEIGVVLKSPSLSEAADYFIAEAKRRGGTDNITVVLAGTTGEASEIKLKSTREVYLPGATRDADLPTNISNV